MAEPVVDAFEMIDVQHQADEAVLFAARTPQLLLESHLQVTAIVPAGQHIGETAAQKARAVQDVFDAIGSNQAQVLQEIAGMMPGKTIGIVAAEID